MRSELCYQGGYKYLLQNRYFVQTQIFPAEDIVTEYITLLRSGLMIIERRYAWDGPSGPAIDTPSVMAGSLVHDAGYQLIREGYLPESFKAEFDALLKRIIKEDSCLDKSRFQKLRCAINRIRAEYFYDAVEIFGTNFLRQQKKTIRLKPGVEV